MDVILISSWMNFVIVTIAAVDLFQREACRAVFSLRRSKVKKNPTHPIHHFFQFSFVQQLQRSVHCAFVVTHKGEDPHASDHDDHAGLLT
jgi:imidazoleglycerol phosphate dehydratase HisB